MQNDTTPGRAPGQGPLIDRRTLIRGAAGTALAGSIATVLPAATLPASAADGRDYADRATFDWAEEYFHTNFPNLGPGQLDGGNLSWTQSYVLRSYLVMYQATDDTHYLDLFIRNAEQMLATRNSELGVTDYRGLSRPVWRIRDPYTVGIVDLADADGRPLVRIRSGATGSNRGSVTVSAGSGPGRFTLVATTRAGTSDTFTDVTLDPQNPNYLVTRMRDVNPGFSISTAVDLRADRSGAQVPVAGRYTLTTQFYDQPVNTGMIVAPMAEFAAIVHARRLPSGYYRLKGKQYARAAREAIDCFDEEYRTGSNDRAWYIWSKGAPFYLDGTEAPHNMYLVMATAMMHLADVENEPAYADRARRLLTTFRDDLIPLGAGYTWPYWWSGGHIYNGYTWADDVSEHAPNWPGTVKAEDVSHGMLDIEAAVVGYRHGLVFTDAEMRRLASTFVDKIATHDAAGLPTLYNLVDGTGGTGTYNLTGPVWAPLAQWHREVFTFNRELFNARQYVPNQAHILLAIAHLVAEARR